MTVKLLATYDRFGAGAVVRYPITTELSLIYQRMAQISTAKPTWDWEKDASRLWPKTDSSTQQEREWHAKMTKEAGRG